MRLTRRNTIVGLGALAAGAGVIGGSGAFDAVEADRSFEVEVAGDAQALLGLAVHNETIAGTEEGGAGDDDVLFFRLDADGADGINEDAETRFFEVFEVMNNGSQVVRLTVDTGDVDGVTFQVTESRGDNGDVVNDDVDLEDDGVDLNAGQLVTVDLIIDTTEEGGYVEPDDDDPHQMTLRAESEAAQDA